MARVFEQTRIMPPGSRILYYVPIQFKYRAKAIRDIEYQVRQDKKYQTRIKMSFGRKLRRGKTQTSHQLIMLLMLTIQPILLSLNLHPPVGLDQELKNGIGSLQGVKKMVMSCESNPKEMMVILFKL